MHPLPSLNEILNYKNPLVIRRFQREFPHLAEEAPLLFVDMLKYLWLCKKHAQDIAAQEPSALGFTCVMHPEMNTIDEMWHTFILITQDYAAFCQKYFGEFLHHVPEVGEQINEVTVDKDVFKQELQLFLSYVYNHLGEDTLRRWFGIYLSNPEPNV